MSGREWPSRWTGATAGTILVPAPLLVPLATLGEFVPIPASSAAARLLGSRSPVALLLAFVLAVVGAVTVDAPRATAAPHDGSAGTRIAATASAGWTPWVRDGQVLAITQVGDLLILGGTFTAVGPPRTDTSVPRTSLVAVDARTGAIHAGFAPVLNGSVETLLPGPVAGTVYAGGTFTTVNGAARKSLVLLHTATGQMVTGWASPYVNGAVMDLALHGNRLIVGGTFTKVGSFLRGGLVSVSATTGRPDEWMRVNLTEHHNWYEGSTGAKAGVGVQNFDLTPDGRTLVVIGNFRKADGLERRQIALLDLSGTVPSVRTDWATSRFATACSTKSFDSWVRDVDVAADGTYFAVVTTGGPFTNTLCDTTTRWDLDKTGTDVAPRWISVTGGDTLFSVAVTPAAVYVGGHQRWLNNPDGRDKAAGGAVPRPGIGALDPRSGIPLSWNPGRHPRGIGTTALFASDDGLWVGSDTKWIGNYTAQRWRIAYFPFASGSLPTGDGRWSLPANVYKAGYGTSIPAGAMRRHYYTGTRVDHTTDVTGTGVDWTTVRGAFVVDRTLFHGSSDGLLYRRSFDGSTVGAAELVDPYNDPYWSTVATGSGTSVYRGLRPGFYGTELANVTGMAYADGRLFYTLPGYDRLYWRWFSPDSGIVHHHRNEVPGAVVPMDVAGLFIADGSLWYASGTGTLTRRPLDAVAPALGAAQVVGGPAVDGIDWRGKALFPGPGPLPPENEAPRAAWTPSCTGLTCAFDASASTDPDGSITGYAWTFGDGSSATGSRTTHTFGAPGTYTVTLTVTDDRGATGSRAAAVTVSTGNVAPVAEWTVDCADLRCAFDATASTDSDGSITAYDWAFGDGSTGTGPRVDHDYPATGTYAVTLTVTDNVGARATSTRNVSVVAAPSVIGFRATTSARSGWTNPSIQVPGDVQAGDALLLFTTVNSTTPTITGPAGWAEVRRQVSGSMVSVLWSRVAGHDDANSLVQLRLSATAKTDLQLVAYAGTAPDGAVATAASAASRGLQHTTPAIADAERGAMAVSFWVDKSGTTRTWAPPAEVVVRGTSVGSGAGHLNSVLADGGTPVAAGTDVGGLTATTDLITNAVTWTVLLQPAAG